VHVARDGQEALDFVLGHGPFAGYDAAATLRLIMLDVKLPKVTGLDVLREIKTNASTRAIPVVLLTSSNLTRDVALAYQLGANSYVQKPVDFQQFRDAIRLVGVYWLRLNMTAPGQSPTSGAWG
jgi:CheY-like chemotaxis protein